MIIKGHGNSSLHITKDNDMNKYMVVGMMEVKQGFHKSVKLIADNVQSFSEDSHSIEISGAHYAVMSGMDFLPMIDRISKSRSYRIYKASTQEAA